MDRAEALSQVHRQEWGRMVAIASRALPRGEAEDVVAEAFAHAWQTATDMAPEHLRRYIWKCVWNGCSDLHRRGRHRREVELDLRGQTAGSREFRLADARLDIDRVWGELTNRQREALWLHFGEGLSYPEIAAQQGITDAGVRRAAFRGWETMRRRLTGRAR
jgi:RNA polymerase sigma factor (sigma-70 family)